jgi:hypothetical protein
VSHRCPAGFLIFETRSHYIFQAGLEFSM